MRDTALVIMAAGMGSRFGGMKQLTPMGPDGQVIMDYSIHDALEAGFDRIVFVIRRDMEADFRKMIGDRVSKRAEVSYAFQELADLPGGRVCPEKRKKPWGTGQAVWAAREAVKDPFLVINADDYYGKEGFRMIHDYLAGEADRDSAVYDICMGGFLLENTLSENGGVSRGVCRLHEDGTLAQVTETYNIRRAGERLLAEDATGNPVSVDRKQRVSMNMWGLPVSFLQELENSFAEFLDSMAPGDDKAEFQLPGVIDRLIQEKRASVRVLETGDRWFGVTYKEDREAVAEAFRQMHRQGLYPAEWNI